MLKNVQGSSSLHDALTVLVFSSKARSQFPIPTLPNGNSLCYPFPMLVIQQYVVPKTLVKCDCVWSYGKRPLAPSPPPLHHNDPPGP
ncbi:hypothetical protein Y032_0053g2300 [Ancylostoma ceylanicum]|nr:hypothetical protein Y032_0053g2300 [Ancylostoma ceylanicum]